MPHAYVTVNLSLVQEALNTLAELRSDVERLREEKKEAVPKRVQESLARVDEKFKPRIEAVQLRLEEVEKQIRHSVLHLQTSVKGDALHAIYMSPRKTCDIHKLEGYAAAHPEVQAFIKEGEPSVAIREILKKAAALPSTYPSVLANL